MTAALLTRVIETAQTLARELGDQPLLDRLSELQSRSSLERTEDICQLVSDMGIINRALEISVQLTGATLTNQRGLHAHVVRPPEHMSGFPTTVSAAREQN
ncbi:hypothetical protein GCM10008955_40530 [Deinococcus malanensis]|uniref:Uncharacterized protein n=1 Tax=Deinococcus malanensis TaxID=1706855 RepID=A0ABQ2F5C4_9DEIO|nr:hypothetical protein [Deinococcus malanensis]GGK42664.1 hypothetical protein GCM10008955_40530 [Deinococcus malanensis]